ncbi:hypothetical protein ColTof4_01138 [Colletotrichum tofieldiae]|nr:hypothetical protein ColTof3_08364 [Colletotrichum tofieldiae]GKT68715.1 hypothetical protein ColTof4_01138 [Colletotrichum tofieldiae]
MLSRGGGDGGIGIGEISGLTEVARAIHKGFSITKSRYDVYHERWGNYMLGSTLHVQHNAWEAEVAADKHKWGLGVESRRSGSGFLSTQQQKPYEEKYKDKDKVNTRQGTIPNSARLKTTFDGPL